jgi:hypothetical protein
MKMSTRRRDTQRIDRRRFLTGAAGSVLALPMLEATMPRLAFGQGAAPPKRLVVILHPHGRWVGNGTKTGAATQDNWSPLQQTGPYPATGNLSPALASLSEMRKELVTIDGVDNLVRHMVSDPDGHKPASLTCLTCARPTSTMKGGGPSIDFVAGERLRASGAQQSALVFPESAMDFPWRYAGTEFYRANGTPPTLVESNPAQAIQDLFGSLTMSTTPPPKPTLHDRLVSRRPSILDAVAKSYVALEKGVSAADRDRLAQHANFIQTLETRLGGGGGTALAKGCAKPDASLIPKYDPAANQRCDLDGQVTPWIIENLVMSLACDVTRVASLHFSNNNDPTYSSEFTGTSPFAGGNNHHAMVHDTPQLSATNAAPLTQAFQFHDKMALRLIKRLSEVTDTDGSRLLDNTLVLWVGDMGYGATHAVFNVPVVMAGMKSAFPKGQGRHVVLPQRHSLGDLYAQVLRMLGGSDMTFGATGKIGDSGLSGDKGLNTYAGYPGYITGNVPLHSGPLDL